MRMEDAGSESEPSENGPEPVEGGGEDERWKVKLLIGLHGWLLAPMWQHNEDGFRIPKTWGAEASGVMVDVAAQWGRLAQQPAAMQVDMNVPYAGKVCEIGARSFTLRLHDVRRAVDMEATARLFIRDLQSGLRDELAKDDRVMVVPYAAVSDGSGADVEVRLCSKVQVLPPKERSPARKLVVVEVAGVLGKPGLYQRWMPHPSASGFLLFLARHFDVLLWTGDGDLFGEGAVLARPVALVGLWGPERAVGGKKTAQAVWDAAPEVGVHDSASTVFVVPTGGKTFLDSTAAALAVECADSKAATAIGGNLRTQLKKLADCASVQAALA